MSQNKARSSRERLESTLEAIPDLMFELDAEGRHWDCRALKPELLVAPPPQLLGHTVAEVMPPAAAQAVMAALAEATAHGTSQGTQIHLPTPNGDRWFEVSMARKTQTGDGDLRFIVLSRDITERKQAQLEAERLAFFDSLTGLANRRLLRDRLRTAVTASARSDSFGALMFIDLDNFKALNDGWGHATGDAVLQRVSDRLRGCVRDEDTVARWGGDEFVVMLQRLAPDNAGAAPQAARVGAQLIDRLGVPYELDGNAHRCTASIGVCLFCGDQDIDELLRRADAAMYSAKRAGRNKFVFFDPSTQRTLVNRARFRRDLCAATEREEFHLDCQPQADSAHRIVGAELLLRWQHPVRGLVLPSEFISVAEKNDLIVPIGQWVLEQACVLLSRWQSEPRYHHLTLSVNVSECQLRDVTFAEQLRNLMQESGVDPERLTLELSENVLDDTGGAFEAMHRLKALGLRLAMDGFGAEGSSLAALCRAPLDQLKINQSFVRTLLTDVSSVRAASTIVAMARSLAMNVVAVGVETQAQRDQLLALGCEYFQGYHCGPPLPLQSFLPFGSRCRSAGV